MFVTFYLLGCMAMLFVINRFAVSHRELSCTIRPANGKLLFTIAPPIGPTFEMEILDNHASGLALYEKVSDLTGIPKSILKLYKNGKKVHHDASVSDGGTIYAHIPVKGGAPPTPSKGRHWKTKHRTVQLEGKEQTGCDCQGACNCPLPYLLSTPSSYNPSPGQPYFAISSPYQPSPGAELLRSEYQSSQTTDSRVLSGQDTPSSYNPSPGQPYFAISSPYQPSPGAELLRSEYQPSQTTDSRVLSGQDTPSSYNPSPGQPYFGSKGDSLDVYDFNENDQANALPYVSSTRQKSTMYDSNSDSDLGVHRLESSDDDPSGLSDTNSEPFDSSYYIPASKTPTARTKNHAGGSGRAGAKLLDRAVKRETLHKTLSMSPCCRSKCSQRFTYRDLKKNREKYFGCGDASARSSWLIEKFSSFQNSENELKTTFSFKANGKVMCRKAWCRLHGIKKKVYYKGRTAFLDGRPSASERIRPRRQKSPAYVKANVWFERYLSENGEKMPHRKETWLPYRTRKQGVYHQYRQEKALEMEPYCSKQTFYNMWNEMHDNVFIKKSSLFTKCKKCVQLERKLERTRIPRKRLQIQDRRRAHLDRQMRERLNYYRRREAAHRNPNRYLSLIIDGMDQAKTYLPHFVGPKSKDMASTDLMKVHVSGIISHGHGIKATYTDVFEYKHDSNLTINLLLKMLYRLSKRGPLPPILYVQADNCFRENKNRFMLAFLDLLVHQGIFAEVQLSFLYVGHTHEDIDQLFSQIADRLRHEEARTPKQLLEKLPDAAEMRGLYDVRGWLEPYIVNIKGHSKVGMFRFRKNTTMRDRVDMFYRRSNDHGWKILRTGMFRANEENVPVRPAGRPKLLLPVFEKREINVTNLMSQKLPKWTPYLESEEANDWKKYLGDLKTASQSQPAKLRYASGDGTGWLLNQLSAYSPAELENRDGAEACISQELDRLLEEEVESAEIVVQGSTVGKRKRGGKGGRGRGRPRGARGGGRGRGGRGRS
ncbi:Hypp6767 [Branchiostoma lanceolatum]|uniref:Hypp6767 protein n=1 Tax=Branchiostoma lanceolatum TaxID=7740 RepID=A0A8J9YVN2_BRALA|nr:Hypp6767 [Branchiostoma lanceolatum]